jgi:long-chain acyl-CoA synthetase
MATLWGLLEESARRFGSKTALKTMRGNHTDEWSYQRLRDFSERMAAHLRSLDIGKGERVLVYAPNMPEWVGLYFGCLRAGVVLVPLDIRSSQSFMRSVNERADARCVFVSRAVAEDLPELGIPVRFLEDLSQEAEAVDMPSMPYPEEDDIAVIMFTSGTTGRPKGVVLTHRNIASNVEEAVQIVPSESRYRLLSLLPLSHMLEQTVGMLAPLKGGATIVYPTSRQPRILFQTLREERITTIAMVPQVLQLFWNGIEREVSRQGKEKIWGRMLTLARFLPMRGRRLLFHSVHSQLGGSMEFFMCGGAYLDPELARKWELLGVPVLQGYGTTEASPIIAASSMQDRKPDSVGKPLPGQEIRIAPDGEILIKGANVTIGYWDDPDATEAVFEDGWYRTGDMGYLDEAGHLHIHGRKKDMIILDNGMNVHAQDVEETLKQSTDVADACVVGLTGRGGRVRVHAALLLKDGAGDPDAIVQQANRRLAEYQRIHEYTIWPFEDFPRTHTLKIKKHEVVAYLTSRTEPDDSGKSSNSSTSAIVPSTIA